MNKTNIIILAVICVYLVVVFPKIQVSSDNENTNTSNVSSAPTYSGLNNEGRNTEGEKKESTTGTVPTMNGFTA